MTEAEHGPVKMSAEDNGRMRRLYEEIVSRYAEMRLIVQRVSGKKPNKSARGSRTKIEVTAMDEGGHACIRFPDTGEVWEDPPGICRSGTCD